MKICEICVSPKLSKDTVAYLELLIEEHHEHFRQVYPNESVIPKMHFMVHFPEQILRYGPLIHSWTMRHEVKLRVIKCAAKVSNFKNVCQTVAKCHQFLLCYYINPNLLLRKPLDIGPCKDFTCSEDVKSMLQTKNLFSDHASLQTTTFATYNGFTFKPNAYILLQSDRLSPTFGKISAILKLRVIIFVVQEYKTQYYDSHYQAYSISNQILECVYTKSTAVPLHFSCKIFI